MIFIFEISLLNNWKKEAEKARKLSITELAKRGHEIERRLQKKLAAIDSTLSPWTGTSLGNASETVLAPTSIEITRIFALTAMTYLHVTVSGTHPELPEIVGSVSKTVAALQRLTDPRLLRNLVWPFCISRCPTRRNG